MTKKPAPVEQKTRYGKAEKVLRDRMPIDLGDGLQIRFARQEDIDPLCALIGLVWPGWSGVTEISHDFYSGVNPKASYADTLIVEDTTNDRLVSYLSLISRNWSYGGVPFKCGHVEDVGTHPDYRQRGLVGRLFDAVHQLSAARGELFQVVWGIEWVYRKFGYTYALPSFGGGSWRVPKSQIPTLPEGEQEPYLLRPLKDEDKTFVKELYQRGMERGIFAAVKNERDWEFLFWGNREYTDFKLTWYTVNDLEDRTVGYLSIFHLGHSSVIGLELAKDAPYLLVMPSLLRQLANLDSDKPMETVYLSLPANHPAGNVLPVSMRHDSPGNALYVRIPDVVKWLRHIRPALEANLVGTGAEGYTGELKINCLSWGVHMALERGRIVQIEPWQAQGMQQIHHRPRFVFDTFIQLVCGFKRCRELMAAYPDCGMDKDTEVLLDILFPPFYGGLLFNGY